MCYHDTMNWLARLWARDPVAAALRTMSSGTAPAEERSRACACLEERLRQPDLALRSQTRLTSWGRTCLVRTKDSLRLVWKPGEALARREEAAYRLDRAMGHAALVPPVVLRELGGQKGALRFYLPRARPSLLDHRRNYILQCPERPSYARVALLDCLIGNRDRHAGNWLITAGGTVIPIDHGLSFPRRNDSGRIHACDFVHPVPALPVDLAPGALEELKELVGPEALRALQQRLERVRELGHTYRWWEGADPAQERFLDSYQAEFVASTGLEGVAVSNPDDYGVLLEHIGVHRWYLGEQAQRDISLAEAADSWRRSIFEPACQAMHESGLVREFPRRSLAELYLWLTYHRERMKQPDHSVAGYLAERYSGRPWPRIWKALQRSLRAALQAARESPEPPGQKQVG